MATYGPDTFGGTPGTQLHSYDSNWNCIGTDGSTHKDSYTVIATAGNAVKVASGGYATLLSWNNPGVDGSNAQWVECKIKDVTAASARKLSVLIDQVNNKGFGVYIQTGPVLKLFKFDDSSILATSVAAPSVNDVLAISTTGSAGSMTVTAYINGTNVAQATSQTTSSGQTKTGWWIDVSQTVDPWFTNFRTGSGAYPGIGSGGAGTPPGRVKSLSGGMHDLTGNMQG